MSNFKEVAIQLAVEDALKRFAGSSFISDNQNDSGGYMAGPECIAVEVGSGPLGVPSAQGIFRRLVDEYSTTATYKIPACAGKPYRPSNGTESEMFCEQWCRRCMADKDYRENDGESCPIIVNAFVYQNCDADYPPKWKHDHAGRPICTAFIEDVDAQ